jgi:NADH-quinone oxidoreductase subunit J
VTVETIVFWLVAAPLVAASLAVVLTPNLFHAVLYLAAALVATGVVFLLLGSPFLFAVQLLLYAGGVVTVLVFAIMLTERLVGERLTQSNRWIVNGAIVAAAVFVGVFSFLMQARRLPLPEAGPDRTAAVARAITGPFVAPFELLGVLLVAALLGALYFARPDD